VALLKQIVEVPLTAGVDETAGEHTTGNPSLLLTNYLSDRVGQLVKRRGVVEETTDLLAGGSLPSGIAATAMRGAEQLCVGFRPYGSGSVPGSNGRSVYARVADGRLHLLGPHTPFVARTLAHVHAANDSTTGLPSVGFFHNVHAVIAGAFLFVAWVGSADRCYTRVIELTTGTVVVERYEGPALRGVRLHRCGDGTVVVVRVDRSDTAYVRRYVVSNPVSSTSTYSVVFSGVISAFDTTTDEAGALYIAARVGTSVETKRVVNLTAAVTATANLPGAAASQLSVAYSAVSGGRVLIGWRTGTPDMLALSCYDAALSVLAFPTIAVIDPLSPPLAVVNNVLVGADSAGRIYYAASLVYASLVPSVIVCAVSSSGVLLSWPKDLFWCDAITKPWSTAQGTFLTVSAYWTPGPSLSPNAAGVFGYAVVNLRDAFNDENAHPTLSASLYAENGLGPSNGFCSWSAQAPQPDSSGAVPLGLVLVRRGSDYSLAYDSSARYGSVALVEAATSGGLSISAEAGGLAILGGALTTVVDGQAEAEVGFLSAPSVVDVTATPGTGPGPGQYTWVFLWEWEDSTGRIHRSRPSAPYTDTLAVASQMDFEIRSSPITRRTPASGVSQRPRLAVYRTEANGSVLYRCTGDGGGVLVASAPLTAFTDDWTDTVLLDAGLGIYPYAGGELESCPAPPARHLLTAFGRVFLTSSMAQEVWPSQPLIEGEAPSFHPALRITLDAEREAMGCARLDGALVVLGREGIYLVDSDGPPLTGIPGWGTPARISAPGCANTASIVSFPLGVFYEADAGLVLLGRDRSASLVWQVTETLGVYSRIRSAVSDEQEARVLFLCQDPETGQQIVLCYSYSAGSAAREIAGFWTILLYPGIGTIHTLLANPVRLVGAASHVEYGRSFGDDSYGGADHPTSGRFVSPWVRIGPAGGYQRVWRAYLDLYVVGPCELLLRVYVDGGTAPVQSETWSEAQVAAMTEGGGRARITVGMRVQKCHAIRLELVQTEPEEPYGVSGVRIVGVSLEIGVKQGVEKAPIANRR
jgi:hypothetical protein